MSDGRFLSDLGLQRGEPRPHTVVALLAILHKLDAPQAEQERAVAAWVADHPYDYALTLDLRRQGFEALALQHV